MPSWSTTASGSRPSRRPSTRSWPRPRRPSPARSAWSCRPGAASRPAGGPSWPCTGPTWPPTRPATPSTTTPGGGSCPCGGYPPGPGPGSTGMGDRPGDAGPGGPSRPLWAGGFAGAPDPGMWAYTSSLAADRRLWRQDVAGSRAHVRGLVVAGVLKEGEGKLLLDGLAQVAGELAAGRFAFADGDEDVHSAVERRLTELVGPAGGKLHTGRSRNDQVATDLHLWLKQACADAVEALAGLIDALVGAGRAAGPDAVVPGLTHLQPAQPVLWAFQLAAHGFALARDVGRFQDAGRRADVSPLGAGAIAGSSFPLDPAATATALGFAAAFDNAMDATADRDGVAELLAAAALAMVH